MTTKISEIDLQKIILDALHNIGANIEKIEVVKPKIIQYGDYSTSVAFKVGKLLNLPVLEVAEKIVNSLDKEMFLKVEIVKPGFINFFLKKETLVDIVDEIIKKGDSYGQGNKKNFKINIEFVSANPTGDLHIGHLRCAIFGDSLARIMSFAGFDVTREYYINDAGNQIKMLGESIYQRYLQLFNYDFCIPDDGYAGKDIIEIAKYFKKKYGDKFLKRNDENLSFITNEGLKIELNSIKKVLASIGVKFDVFSSEKELYKNGDVKKTLDFLQPYSYVCDGVKFVKTANYLDDKDRVIVKNNGDYTYFLPDIAYHYNKISRGFDLLIDVLGSDHHGYINRLKSALMFKGYKSDVLKVLLVQFVRLVDGQKEIKMSKRSGFSLTISDLYKEINKDVIRYFFLTRDNNSHLDFDLNVAKKQNDSNPVYYVMYAHARLSSILEIAKSNNIKISTKSDLLKEKIEFEILKMLKDFPIIIETIAKNYKVHKIVNYVHSLAILIHSYYNKCRVIDKNSLDVSAQRLGLVYASKIVFFNALKLMGIKALDRMEKEK